MLLEAWIVFLIDYFFTAKNAKVAKKKKV